MNLVGVGGAALPATVGDELVAKGVKLVSRMGSAECGFLMSSHRDYAVDKDWQYLRSSNDPDLLAFEPTGDGLAELVIRPHWPVLAKTNREDGMPLAVAVDKDIASGSSTLPCTSVNHLRNWSSGEGRTEVGEMCSWGLYWLWLTTLSLSGSGRITSMLAVVFNDLKLFW